jgi:hypothetical protein
LAPPKGTSNNPRGRPKKKRALTEALERAGSKTIEVDGKKVSGKQLAARLAWQLVIEGRVELPDGRELKADLDEWLSAVKWIFSQIDGPPKQEMDVTSDGEKITFTLDLGDAARGDCG